MHRTEKDYCPVCNHIINGATDIGNTDHIPKPGDVSVCFYCTSFLQFNDNLKLTEMTNLEVAELDHETRMIIVHARNAIKKMREEDGQ